MTLRLLNSNELEGIFGDKLMSNEDMNTINCTLMNLKKVIRHDYVIKLTTL